MTPVDPLERQVRSWIAVGGDVEWAALPYVFIRHGLTSRAPRGRVIDAVRHVGQVAIEHLALSAVSSDDGVLVVWGSRNQERTLRPVVDALAGRGLEFESTRFRLERRRAIGMTGAARHLADDVTAGLRALHAEVDPSTILRAVLRSVRALAVDLEGTRALVVSTQHDPAVRALLANARRADVPSIYVPHAPTAANPVYADLPANVGALRGEREIDYYASLGGAREGLVVAGAPGVERPSHWTITADLDLTLPVVYAPSPWPEPVLDEQISLLADAVDGSVLVSPHPRMNRRKLAARLPPGWSMWDGDTASLLRRGPWCVVQASSGVAWETLQLGIPTIELRLGSTPPNYSLIDERVVDFVTSPSDCRRAVNRARRVATRPSDRERLSAWARSWCRTVGDEAAEVVADTVLAAATPERRGWVLDGWRRPEP